MDNEDITGIEEAGKRLYSFEPGDLERKRSGLSSARRDTRSAWGDENISIEEMSKQTKTKTPLLKIFFFVSALFFIGAVVFAVSLYMGGVNTVSPDNVDISISGPVSVKGGEELNLQIAITNKNNIPLEYVDLIVTFPKGSKISTNKANDTQYRKNLGTIEPNELITETIKCALFGEENAEKEISVAIEYRNENSNAIIEKTALWKTSISSSPLSMVFDIPEDAASNQEIAVNAKVISNSKETLSDVLVNLSYPSGFIFKSAVPTPSSGNGIWELGDMKQGAERIIKIKGIIQGQNDEEKVFRAVAGVRTNIDSNKVSVAYASSEKSLTVKKPYIDLAMAINGSADEVFVSSDGETIRGDIEWMNNLPVKLLHSEVSVALSGEAIDKSTVAASGGFYKSVENTVFWDKTGKVLPDSIEPGQNGRLTFSLSPLPLLSGKKAIIKNPEITLVLKWKGIRSSEGSDEGSAVEQVLTKKVRLTSNMQVAARAMYYSGPFKNTGTLPPTHDTETTFTVIWSLVNSSNDVSGVKVKTVLPPYARWIGAVSPSTEKVTYNPVGGEVLWEVGSVKAGSGVTVPAKEVAFQIGITPSLSQVGGYVDIISESTVTGTDDFTKAAISYDRKSPTTQLTGDPLVREEETEGVK